MKIAIIEPSFWAQKLIAESITNFAIVSIYKDYTFDINRYNFYIIGPSLSKLVISNTLSLDKTIITLTEIDLVCVKNFILAPPHFIMHLDDMTELNTVLQMSKTNQARFSLTFNQIICHQPNELLLSLTKSEKLILKFIIAGFSNKQIAAVNYKSVLTIETHRKSIKNKLELKGSINDNKDKITPYLAWLMDIL